MEKMGTVPERDICGYPTAETLRRISLWDIGSLKACEPWMEYCLEAIDSDHGRVSRGKVGEYEISTGGWSGNQEIIEAMRRNYIAWALCWFSSRRGGYHQFHLLREKL